MSMYKLIYDDILDNYSVLRKSDGCTFVSYSNGNIDYEQFLQDVKEQGIGIVEGPDVLVKEDYVTARKIAYGPIEDQLDKIYHKGLDVWKSDILAIKDAIPKTQERTTSVGPVPDWVQTEADAYTP
tara:strand:- start:1370 stop:1747 length:378 start_codon:yes stop_codon:yes gene_type:complete